MRDPGRSASGLASALLDGATIDWERARQRVGRPAAQLVANLELVDRIAKASRTSRDRPPVSVRRRGGLILLPVGLFVALAASHVAGGIAGYLFGVSGPGPTPPVLAIGTVLVFAAASCWLGFANNGDSRARNLAVFYLLIAAAFARRFLPNPQAGVFIAAARSASPDAFLAFFLWRFVGQFPRTVRFGPADRLCRLAEFASLAAGVFLFATTVLVGTHAPLWLRLVGRSHPAGLYWSVILGLALPALPVTWWRWRSASPEEGRRLAVFTAGLLVGLGPMLIDVVLAVAFPRFERLTVERGLDAWVFQAFLLCVPFVTAYSVLVDRVFDLHVVVGRALRAVFARATVAVVAGLPFGALALLAYSRRDLSLAQILSSSTGAGMGALAGAGLLMWAGRKPVLGALDRRFFTPAASITRDLPHLAEAMRSASSRTVLAALLETRLTEVLHAARVTMFTVGSGGESFVPVRADVPPLAVRTGLGAIVAAHADPIPVGPSEVRSCFRYLPPPEQDWVAASDWAILLPLVGSHDARVGLIAAGRKENGLPYAREDLAFLATLASAAALALEVRMAGEDDRTEPAAECTCCGSITSSVAEPCDCGSPRQAATVPPVLAGKFKVESRLGAGGMGVVYRARDLALGRVVALKTLPCLSGRASERLHHEAHIMASVVHPNLATIYSLERWRNTPILVVEFLDGGTLSSRLRLAPQPVEDVLRLGRALASALQHLHGCRILHGDVKPSNVAFSATGIPKLLDFGVARLLCGLDERSDLSPRPPALDPLATQSVAFGEGVVPGTPLYLSPEAAAGGDPDDDFDLWALGVVLYEALAGVHPFAAPSIAEVLDNVRATRVPDLRRFRPDCPATVAAMLDVMLSPRRSERPRTAAAFLEMLQVVVTRQPPGSPTSLDGGGDYVRPQGNEQS